MNCAVRACINGNISSSLQLVPASVYVVRYTICHLDPNVNQAYRLATPKSRHNMPRFGGCKPADIWAAMRWYGQLWAQLYKLMNHLKSHWRFFCKPNATFIN